MTMVCRERGRRVRHRAATCSTAPSRRTRSPASAAAPTRGFVLIDLASVGKAGLADRPLDLLHPCCNARLRRDAGAGARRGRERVRCWERIFDSYALFVAFEQLGGAEAALADGARAQPERAMRSAGRSARSRRSSTCWPTCWWHRPRAIELLVRRGRLSLARDALRESSAVARISATEAFRSARAAASRCTARSASPGNPTATCTTAARRRWRRSPGSLRFWKERLVELLPRRRSAHAVAAQRWRSDGVMNFADLPDEAHFASPPARGSTRTRRGTSSSKSRGCALPASRSRTSTNGSRRARVAAQEIRRRLGLPRVAGRVRRPRPEPGRERDLPGGGRPVRRAVRHLHDRPGLRRADADGVCSEEQKRELLPRWPAAKTSGARCSASRAPAPTSPACARARTAATAAGGSTARRSGPRARTTATGASCSCAPIPTRRSTRA